MKKNLKSLIALVVALCALWLTTAQAEDTTTNIISGTLSDNGGLNYAAGATGTNNYLEINSAGVLTNVFEFFIGSNTTARGNSALITGSSSALYATGRALVGNLGSFNTLTITAGGSLSNGGANIFIGNTGSNNTVVVSGTNSLWQAGGAGTTDFRVGGNSPNNKLIITNGGVVRCTTANDYISTGGNNNNSAIVTGPGSAWLMTGDFRVGGNGKTNNLTVANGGTVTNTVGTMGNTATTSSFNWALITDTNSVWRNGNLTVGSQGVGNNMTISNGGAVIANAGVVGSSVTASNNWALVTGGGSSWTCNGNLTVGTTASSNRLTIANGGTVSNTGFSIIGNATGASSNVVVVTGSGSSWQGGDNAYIGTNGSANSLTIAAGGLMINSLGYVGFTNSSSNNMVLVTGAGSVWQNRGLLTVGQSGNGNSLTIAAGGMATNTAPRIGYFANNNSVLVTDSGSLLQCSGGDPQIGNTGMNNSLIVSNGGTADFTVATGFYIGTAAGNGGSNSVLVTGAGSVLKSAGAQFKLGGNGVGNNSLTIADGGMVSNSFTMSVGQNPGCNSNTITVTGAGSTLNLVGNNLTLGANATSTNNVLNVVSGGLLTNAATMTLGGGVNSVFNLGDGSTLAQVVANNVSLAGSGSLLVFNKGRFVANGGATAVFSGTGNVRIKNGGAEIDSQTYGIITGRGLQEDATSTGGGLTKLGTGSLTLSGNNTYTGSTTISNGTLLVTSSLTASSAVAVKSGAAFGGSGIINGPVTVEAGASLRPGTGGVDSSKLTISNTVNLASTALTVIAINRTNANNASTLVVSGALTKDGTFTVTNVGPTLQANDSFTVLTAYGSTSGSFSATNLPALSGNQNWWVTNSGATLLVNEAPTAGDATYTRAAGVGIKNIAIANVLTNVTNVSVGQTISLTGVGSGSQGATIAINGANIQYSPAVSNNNNDSFTYTISDGRGGLATGNILVNVVQVTGQDSGTISVTGTNATTFFFGVPGWTYIVQRSTNLNEGVGWVAISTNQVSPSGVITNADNFSDLSVPPYPSAAYYRLQSQ